MVASQSPPFQGLDELVSSGEARAHFRTNGSWRARQSEENYLDGNMYFTPTSRTQFRNNPVLIVKRTPGAIDPNARYVRYLLVVTLLTTSCCTDPSTCLAGAWHRTHTCTPASGQPGGAIPAYRAACCRWCSNAASLSCELYRGHGPLRSERCMFRTLSHCWRSQECERGTQECVRHKDLLEDEDADG
jgi:hypothetical protein